MHPPSISVICLVDVVPMRDFADFAGPKRKKKKKKVLRVFLCPLERLDVYIAIYKNIENVTNHVLKLCRSAAIGWLTGYTNRGLILPRS